MDYQDNLDDRNYAFPDDYFAEFIGDVYLSAEHAGEAPNTRHLASIRRHQAIVEPEIARQNIALLLVA